MPERSALAAYLARVLGEHNASKVSLGTAAVAATLDLVGSVDPAIRASIIAELVDQRANLKLIGSENYASLPVLMAMGNWLSDKYAEGSVGHRLYAGCDHVDAVEERAAILAKAVFGARHAYMQPHSGIDANLVAYWAILSTRVETPSLTELGVGHVNDLSPEVWEQLRQKLGSQRVMGMSLDAGGHLTHGFRVNISGKMFEQSPYGVHPKTHQIDYDVLREQAREVRPLILVAGYSSYTRHLNFRKFREIADEVGAVLMVDMAHFAGLVAGKVFVGDHDPVAHAQIITSTTHKTLRGPRGGMVLADEEFAPAVDRGCPLVLGGPLPHVMAAKAIALAEARTPEFAAYAIRVVENARALARGLRERGVHVVTGGTDNHLVLIDVSGFGLTGRQAESALREVGITANRNIVPFDTNGAWYTSGMRFGTPAATTRGIGVSEMVAVAGHIADVLENTRAGTTASGGSSRASFNTNSGVAARVRAATQEMLRSFPLYPEIEIDTSGLLDH